MKKTLMIVIGVNILCTAITKSSWADAMGSVVLLTQPNDVLLDRLSVNSQDQLVGTEHWSYASTNQSLAFSYDLVKGGAVSSIPGTSGSDFSPANAVDPTRDTWLSGVNNSGQVIGLDGGYHIQQPFVTVDGKAVNLPSISAINNEGQVVGTDGSGLFVYDTRDGSMKVLGAPAGGSTYAVAINDAGQFVANHQLDVSYATSQVVLYSGGAFHTLAGLPGASSSSASGINASGQIAGTSVIDGSLHAFLAMGGTTRDLGLPPGFASLSANSLNDAGDVVGTAFADASSSQIRAFLYHDGSLTNLNSLINPGLGLTLLTADLIDSKGRIFGVAETAGGDVEYMYVPPGLAVPEAPIFSARQVPEPTSAAVFLVSGLGMVIRRVIRRQSGCLLSTRV